MGRRKSGDQMLINAIVGLFKAIFSGLAGASKAAAKSRQGRSSTRSAASSRSASRSSEPQVPARKFTAALEWPVLHDYDFEVVGESAYQANLRKAAGSHGDDPAEKEVDAYIVPEDDNPHDNMAVAIYVKGRKVGHMARDDARDFRARLDTKGISGRVTKCKALISGGGKPEGASRRYFYGISLGIATFEYDDDFDDEGN